MISDVQGKKNEGVETSKSSKVTHPQLKNFLGRSYVLSHNENYDKFLRELGVRKNTRLQAINSKPTVSLTEEGEEFVLSTNYPEGGFVKMKFRPGEVVSRRRTCTSTASSVFHILDNKLIEEEYVDGKEVTIEREFNKRDLLVTMEVNDVKCYRLFTVLEGSQHSIKTETSRRSCLWEESQEDIPEEEVIFSYTTAESEEETEMENVCY